MKNRKLNAAFGLTLAAGALYLFDASFGSIYLEPCTASGPGSPVPCNDSIAIVSWLTVLGLVMVFLGIVAFVTIPSMKLRSVWLVSVFSASIGGYCLLLVLISLNSYSPAVAAEFGFGAIFLPGLVCGLLGGRIGLGLKPAGSTRPASPAPPA